jgi:hypothetical protein
MLKPKEKLSKTPLLTSNNSALLEIVRDYFEIKWLTALESDNSDYQKLENKLLATVNNIN